MYMRKTLLIVFIALIVTVVTIHCRTAEAPILTLQVLEAKKITNKDLPKLIELVAKEENIDSNLMIKIAQCESTLRHFNEKGEVLRGYENNNDGGVMQINKTTWQEKANELGFDLDNPIQNIKMAA